MPDTTTDTKDRWAGGEFEVVFSRVKDRKKLPSAAQDYIIRVPAPTGDLLHDLFGGVQACMRHLQQLLQPELIKVPKEYRLLSASGANDDAKEWSINASLRERIAARDQAAEVDKLADFSQVALEAELDRRAETAA